MEKSKKKTLPGLLRETSPLTNALWFFCFKWFCCELWCTPQNNFFSRHLRRFTVTWKKVFLNIVCLFAVDIDVYWNDDSGKNYRISIQFSRLYQGQKIKKFLNQPYLTKILKNRAFLEFMCFWEWIHNFNTNS